ncbi:hypothetical protein AMTR_s00008p00241420 [Amborella trichopoda]|uniref:Uncharacterized protein n=1 Tax=Amborella trichopoda TaxID=13333 RepID=W1NI01_AMBTC|nr:hypothetical protein AMTR_s00008p00241420 [Amborella trichopoda]
MRIAIKTMGVRNYGYVSRENVESLDVVAKGETLEYNMTLDLVQSLDLSSNPLEGEIPEELTSLMALVFLNLSRNHLSGVIPEKIAKLKQLQSLDLSNNKLSGFILPTISSMTSLSSKGKHEPPPSVDRIGRSRNIFEFPGLDMSIGLGFGIGCWGTILLLFIRKP